MTVETYQDARVTSAEIIKDAIAYEGIINGVSAGHYPPHSLGMFAEAVDIDEHKKNWDRKSQEPTFYETLKLFCVVRGLLDAGKLTEWLRVNENRVAGGHKFVQEGKKHGVRPTNITAPTAGPDTDSEFGIDAGVHTDVWRVQDGLRWHRLPL